MVFVVETNFLIQSNMKQSPRRTDGRRSSTKRRNPAGMKNLAGEQIRLFREKRGWSQQQLAESFRKIGSFITRDIIANIETQRCTVTDWQMILFARVLGVSWKSLLPAKSILNNLTPPFARERQSKGKLISQQPKRTPKPSFTKAARSHLPISEITCKSVKITFRSPP
jgi:transcriptional regulator with XRE-family HTH domain